MSDCVNTPLARCFCLLGMPGAWLVTPPPPKFGNDCQLSSARARILQLQFCKCKFTSVILQQKFYNCKFASTILQALLAQPQSYRLLLFSPNICSSKWEYLSPIFLHLEMQARRRLQVVHVRQGRADVQPGGWLRGGGQVCCLCFKK
jgi:hypothetical protein